MKKILRIILIVSILLFFVLSTYKVFATTTMTLSAKFNDSKISAGTETVINIAIDKLSGTEQGVNAYVFSFSFNTNEFDFVKVEGLNNWNTPAYNENGIKSGKAKFAATRSSFIKEPGNVAKITLKAKKSFDANNSPSVKIDNISFAEKVNNNVQKITLNDINVTLNSESKNAENVDNSKQNNNNNSGEKNNNKNTKEKSSVIDELPDTGLKHKIWIALFGVLTINIVLVYKKYKNIKNV